MGVAGIDHIGVRLQSWSRFFKQFFQIDSVEFFGYISFKNLGVKSGFHADIGFQIIDTSGDKTSFFIFLKGVAETRDRGAAGYGVEILASKSKDESVGVGIPDHDDGKFLVGFKSWFFELGLVHNSWRISH